MDGTVAMLSTSVRVNERRKTANAATPAIQSAIPPRCWSTRASTGRRRSGSPEGRAVETPPRGPPRRSGAPPSPARKASAAMTQSAAPAPTSADVAGAESEHGRGGGGERADPGRDVRATRDARAEPVLDQSALLVAAAGARGSDEGPEAQEDRHDPELPPVDVARERVELGRHRQEVGELAAEKLHRPRAERALLRRPARHLGA